MANMYPIPEYTVYVTQSEDVLSNLKALLTGRLSPFFAIPHVDFSRLNPTFTTASASIL